MADLTIHELQNEATSPAANDYMVLDGATAGTRKTLASALATWIHNKWAAFVNALTAKTSFASDDKIPVVNGSTATAMSKDTLLELTAQNALAGNVAPAFDPTRTSDNPYKAGESVAYEGKTYTFKVNHYGAWNSSDVRLADNIADKVLKLQEKAEVTPDFTTGKNLINKADFSELGEWCNYANGVIESTQYVTNYRHTPYIRVKASTGYAVRNTYGNSGTVFFDSNFAFISGVKTSTFTTPANCAYLIRNINTSQESIDDALLIESGSYFNNNPKVFPTPKYYNEFTYPKADNAPEYVYGSNLINKDKFSELGEWCNYANGKIESTQYVTNYRHTPPINVKASTDYAVRSNRGGTGTSFFDGNGNFISGVTTDTFTTPANCVYLIRNINTDTESIDDAALIEGSTAIATGAPTPPYYIDFKYANPNVPRDYVVVAASGGDFTSVGEAFAYALENDKWVLIKPGVYDLVQEGISGIGYKLPKKVVGYGAKLVCNLVAENWNLSPLNTHAGLQTIEVYGLEVECTNCRYTIHDDRGGDYYHHIFKDLVLTHNSLESETLLAPDNIGGGIGYNGCYVEIDNCIMNAAWRRNFAYHTNSGGLQSRGGTIICRNSKFNKTIGMAKSGTDTSYMNILYVSNCAFADQSALPTDYENVNVKIIPWNNAVHP